MADDTEKFRELYESRNDHARRIQALEFRQLGNGDPERGVIGRVKALEKLTEDLEEHLEKSVMSKDEMLRFEANIVRKVSDEVTATVIRSRDKRATRRMRLAEAVIIAAITGAVTIVARIVGA